MSPKVEVDRFAGAEDPVEIIKIWHMRVAPDRGKHFVQYPRPIWQVYQELNGAQIERLVAHTIEMMGSDFERAETIAGALASFTSDDLRKLQMAMLDRGHYRPSHLFRGAADAVRDRLLGVTTIGGSREEISRALLALAWIGDEVVQAQFARWQATPPTWAARLYVPPASYTRYAGWELTAEGKRRELTIEPCWPLVPRGSDGDPSVLTMGVSEDACRWCAQPLTVLLQIDASDPRFRDWDLGGESVGVATCLDCSFSGFVFSRPDETGRLVWSSDNARRGILPDDVTTSGGRFPAGTLVVGHQPRLPYMAVDWGLAPPASQAGGHPSWVQDADYPTCPGCQQTMVFLGQIAVEDISEVGEGVYYAFVCAPCRTGASTFQQT